MTKELLTIEFRYSDAPRSEYSGTYNCRTVTIGVFDTLDEACVEGNKLMETLEAKFPLHVFPNGIPAAKERFSKNGGPFGSRKDLITNMAYLKTPFEFYAKITTLKYADIDETINGVLEARTRYVKYKTALDS